MEFPSATQPTPSGTVVGVAITVCVTGMTFLVLVQVFAQGILDFGEYKLHELAPSGPIFIGLGPICALTIFNPSTVFIEVTAVARVAANSRTAVVLEQRVRQTRTPMCSSSVCS